MSFDSSRAALVTSNIERPVPVHTNSSSVSLRFSDGDSQSSYTPKAKDKRRVSTFSMRSSTIVEETSQSGRQSTAKSTESGFEMNELRRERTWIVEKEAKHGYPRLATFLGGTKGYSIYRRFAALNARNLLYHQAKLTQLEHELLELEQKLGPDADIHTTVRHVFDAEKDSAEYELHKKHEEISLALDKYNKLLLDQQQLHELPAPDHSLVEAIYSFIGLSSPDPDWLQPPEDTIYAVYQHNRKPVQEDLITLNKNDKARDPFTKFFTNTFVHWWHHIYKLFKEPNVDLTDMNGYVYTEAALNRYMRSIVMIVASALPACSIVALYYIHAAIWRLVFIVLFSIVFSAALTFFTGASRTEVFVGSATLASVQVVFVGTAFGGGRISGDM